MQMIETHGHLYLEGEGDISTKDEVFNPFQQPGYKPKEPLTKLGITGNIAMLLRFGDDGESSSFSALMVATALPWISIGEWFVLDLSGLHGVATIYIDVLSPLEFKFALSVMVELSVPTLLAQLVPWLPEFCKEAIAAFLPDWRFKAGFWVYADSEWWGFKVGPIPSRISFLFGAL